MCGGKTQTFSIKHGGTYTNGRHQAQHGGDVKQQKRCRLYETVETRAKRSLLLFTAKSTSIARVLNLVPLVGG